jgi:hypothetical protein
VGIDVGYTVPPLVLVLSLESTLAEVDESREALNVDELL